MLISSLTINKRVFYLTTAILFFSFTISASQKEKDFSQAHAENEFTSTNKDYCVLVLKAANALKKYTVSQGMKQLSHIFPKKELQEIIVEYAAGYPKYVFFAKLIGHERGISNMRMLPNGLLASDSCEGTVCTWEPSKLSSISSNNKGALVTTTKDLLIRHRECALPYGSRRSRILNCAIQVWTHNKKPEEPSSKGHTFLIAAECTLANGLRCTTSYDKTVNMWDPLKFSTTEPRPKDAYISILENHESLVHCLCALPNNMLAVGLGNGEIIIYKPLPIHLELVWDMYHRCLEYTKYVSRLAQPIALHSIFGKITNVVGALKPFAAVNGLIRYNLLPKNRVTQASKQVDQKEKDEKHNQ